MEAASNIPVGTIKTFGIGPKYQVGQPIRRLDDDDWLVNIVLIETGERAEYRLTRILRDPDAI
jgi:hypothetical protein